MSYFKYFLLDSQNKIRIGFLQGANITEIESMLKATGVLKILGLTENNVPEEFINKRELFVFESEKDGKKITGTIEHVSPKGALTELEGEYAMPIIYLYASHAPMEREAAIESTKSLRGNAKQPEAPASTFSENLKRPEKTYSVLDSEFNECLTVLEKRLGDLRNDKQFAEDVADMKDTLATFRKREVTSPQDKFDCLKFFLRGFSYMEANMDQSPMKALISKDIATIVTLLQKIERLESKSAFGMIIEKNAGFNNPLDDRTISEEAKRYLGKKDIVQKVQHELTELMDREEAAGKEGGELPPEDVSMQLVLLREIPLFLDTLILFFLTLVVVSQVIAISFEKLPLFGIDFAKVFGEFASSTLYMKTVLFLIVLYFFVHIVRRIAKQSGLTVLSIFAFFFSLYAIIYMI